MPTDEFPRRRMNRRGQVTLPAALRKQTGLLPGTEIEWVALEDGILVRAKAPEQRPSMEP